MKITPEIIREFIDSSETLFGFNQGPAYLFEDLDNVTHKFMLYKYSRIFMIYITRFKSQESIDLDLEDLLDLNTWRVEIFCDSDKYDTVRDQEGKTIRVSDIAQDGYDRVFYNYAIDGDFETIDDVKKALLSDNEIEKVDENLIPYFKKESRVDINSVKTYLVNSETGSTVIR